jgi:D-glycerate 3-kinase
MRGDRNLRKKDETMADKNKTAGFNNAVISTIARVLQSKLPLSDRRPFVLGLCGPQGSGKSTLARDLKIALESEGVPAAIMSLDDLYLTAGERAQLATQVHPLFRTRGVPGTHDLSFAFSAIAALADGRRALLPRFNKAADDRCPRAYWQKVLGNEVVIIFEGWCVGASPLNGDLSVAINLLEKDEDADASWRHEWANMLGAGDYQRLFGRIDMLVLLAAPSFDVVLNWRIQQEQQLRDGTGQGMTDQELARFVQFYERLTRHILQTMPDTADLVFRLDDRRNSFV